MLKILLVAPLQEDAHIQNFSAPPAGLYRIKFFAEQVDYTEPIHISIFDRVVDDYDPIEKYKDEKIDILGVSVLHYTLVNTISFITKWKKLHPESLIICGNFEAFENSQELLDKCPVDIIVLGEGEITFVNIIRWKLRQVSLEDIDGIIFRKYQKNIDEEDYSNFYSTLDFSKMRYSDYWDKLARLYENPDYDKINTIRLHPLNFCNLNCRFCSISNTRKLVCGKNVKPSMLSGKDIFSLVDRAAKQLPELKTVYFSDDNSLFYKENFKEFAELYKEAGYTFRILIQTHSAWLDEDIFKILKDIGCVHITVGVENASSRIRKILGKSQSDEHIEQIIEWGKKYNIHIYYLIILIPPESTIEDLRINRDKIKEWIDSGIEVSIEPTIMVYKNTKYWNDDFECNYVIKKIPDTEYTIKHPLWLIPKDLLVKKIAIELMEQKDNYINEYFKSLPTGHMFKGSTSIAYWELLDKLLKKYDVKTDTSSFVYKNFSNDDTSYTQQFYNDRILYT